MSGPPDFVGIGTHEATGLWWAQLLADHPLVHGPVDGAWNQDFFAPFCARPMQNADIAAYHARFPRPESGIVGEWSARYLYDAWTLPLLRRAAPDAKLLVLLRDPVERYESALSYRLAEKREHGKWVSMADMVHRGRYASQLRALYAFFPVEQVLVLQYERCLAEPVAEYERTLAFLGVEPGAVPRRVRRLQHRHADAGRARRAVAALRIEQTAPAQWAQRVRTGRDRVTVELWPDVLASLRSELGPEIVDLGRVAPQIDTQLWRGFDPVQPERSPDGLRARAVTALVGAAVATAGLLTGAAAVFTDLL